MNKLNLDFLSQIDCVGNQDPDSPKICAMANGSFFDKYSWFIFLEPGLIRVNQNNPTLVQIPDSELDSKKEGDNLPKYDDSTQKILNTLLKGNNPTVFIDEFKNKQK
jgi:hypothetical protein